MQYVYYLSICIVYGLSENDNDYGLRKSAIKALFAKEYFRMGGKDGTKNKSRLKRDEAAIWQGRFWEHLIWDTDDFNCHFDYIHYNPVQHALVNQLKDWPWSSFHKYLSEGYYDLEWGNREPISLSSIQETGEYYLI